MNGKDSSVFVKVPIIICDALWYPRRRDTQIVRPRFQFNRVLTRALSTPRSWLRTFDHGALVSPNMADAIPNSL